MEAILYDNLIKIDSKRWIVLDKEKSTIIEPHHSFVIQIVDDKLYINDSPTNRVEYKILASTFPIDGVPLFIIPEEVTDIKKIVFDTEIRTDFAYEYDVNLRVVPTEKHSAGMLIIKSIENE